MITSHTYLVCVDLLGRKMKWTEEMDIIWFKEMVLFDERCDEDRTVMQILSRPSHLLRKTTKAVL